MHIKIRHSFLLLALSFSVPSFASEVLRAGIASSSLKQYERVDIDIYGKAQWRDPYLAKDVAVDVEFTSPSGKTLVLPAFYVAGESKKESHWQARFTPQEVGAYDYKIILVDDGKPQKSIKPLQFSVSASDKKGFLHPYNYWAFKFDNGDAFRGIGENFCWEHRDLDDSKYFKALHENPRFNYEDMLKKLSDNGSNFFRTWMIYWNLPVDWKTVQNNSLYRNSTARFNETGIARMDQLVDIAEKNNMYIMLTLESHVGFMGSGWDTSVYNKKNGGFAVTPEEFFSSPQAKAQYKDKLRFMVARWGYSANIAAWEFFNEIDNVMYANKDARIPDAPVTQWHKEMSEYLAATDPYKHIITTSISHRDVAGLNDIPTINLNQKHIYKYTNTLPEAINDYVTKHQKPYVIGEAGYEWDWSKNFNEFEDGMIGDFKRGLWFGIFSPTPVTPLSWWWEYFDEKGMTPYFKKVNDINLQMLQASGGELSSVSLTTTASDLKIYAVKAGDKYFVYVFNPTAKASSLDIQFKDTLPRKTYQAQRFTPDTGVYQRVAAVTDGKLSQVSVESNQDAIFILQ